MLGAAVLLLVTSGSPRSGDREPSQSSQEIADLRDSVRKLSCDIAEARESVAVLSVSATPVGTVMAFAGTTELTSEGWLYCDGRPLKSAEYPELFSRIGKTYGGGADGSGGTDFNLPDYRGLFLRGISPANDDPFGENRKPMKPDAKSDSMVGTVQGDSLRSHSHKVVDPGHSHPAAAGHRFVEWAGRGPNPGEGDDQVAAFQFRGLAAPEFTRTGVAGTGITLGDYGGSETRPKNAGVWWFIKYRSKPAN
jgi:microcystin-dependent protein